LPCRQMVKLSRFTNAGNWACASLMFTIELTETYVTAAMANVNSLLHPFANHGAARR
jgi:hypothetical protein